jgi:hypothetical protein
MSRVEMDGEICKGGKRGRVWMRMRDVGRKDELDV